MINVGFSNPLEENRLLSDANQLRMIGRFTHLDVRSNWAMAVVGLF